MGLYGAPGFCWLLARDLLSLGIYMVVSGLSFDKSYLLELPSPKSQTQQPDAALFESEMMPLYARSVKPDPTKWEIPIYAFRF